MKRYLEWSNIEEIGVFASVEILGFGLGDGGFAGGTLLEAAEDVSRLATGRIARRLTLLLSQFGNHLDDGSLQEIENILDQMVLDARKTGHQEHGLGAVPVRNLHATSEFEQFDDHEPRKRRLNGAPVQHRVPGIVAHVRVHSGAQQQSDPLQIAATDGIEQVRNGRFAPRAKDWRIGRRMR